MVQSALAKFGLILLLQALCWSLAGQSTPKLNLTADYQDVPLTEILQKLEQQHGLTFSYLANILEAKSVTRRFQNAGWQEVSDFLFRRLGIDVQVLDGGYVVLTTLPPDVRRPQDVCLRILDETDTPLPYVTASINGKEQSFYSDAKGWCRQTLRAADTDSLRLEFIGYAPVNLPLTAINSGRCPEQKMAPSGIDLTSIIVLEYLTDGIDATPEGREVRAKPNIIAAIPGFTENELYRSVQLLPGVNSSDETAADLSIRGGTRDQTQILWDGINIYAPGHYLGMISYFTPELVEDIRIWRGQADATFGGAVYAWK
ncbi:MAG: TonB-dependent receptor plug domain-containing protein [Bacteroidota bacterium]